MDSSKIFTCDVCKVTFSKKGNFDRHQKNQHDLDQPSNCRNKRMAPTVSSCITPTKRIRVDEKILKCNVHDVDVLKSKFNAHIRSNAHKTTSREHDDNNGSVTVMASAFKNRIVTYRLKNVKHVGEFQLFFNQHKNQFIRLVQDKLKNNRSIKINCELFGEYTKMSGMHNVDEVKSFNTKNKIVTFSSNLDDIYNSFVDVMLTKSEEFQTRDSGWTLKTILFVDVNINKCTLLHGSSYIQLPAWIKKKGAVVNVQNNDDACFAWCIVAALYPAGVHPDRISKYPHYSSVLNMDGINLPVSIKDINKFEEINNISVNVFGVEGNSIIGPLHFTVQKRVRHVNLLYIQEGEKSHFCWIKNLSRLVGNQLSKRNNHKWLCDGCLVYFRTEQQLQKHAEHDCNHIATIMPTAQNNILEFKNTHKQLRVPFVIYADFESILKPISSTAHNASSSYTENIQHHDPYSFAFYIKCSYDEAFNKFEIYRGPDPAKIFMQKLKFEARRLGEILKTNVPMKPLTPLDELLFLGAVDCGICKKPLNNDRVRDHDHLNGEFRFAAHAQCNIKYKMTNFIPVVFHNFSGYDSHFIIKELACTKEQITAIPDNKERFISFTKNIKLFDDESEDFVDENEETGEIRNSNSYIQLRFIDSLRFMASSLEKLSKNLDPDQFVEVIKFYPNKKDNILLTRKGFFPYNHVVDVSVLNETDLPPMSAFFNNLTSSDISFADYGHAQKVWKNFNIQNLGEYSDLYLKTDVLLLADVFENFRNVCIKTYDLDPCQYITAPSLTFDAMLKYTEVKLELLTDVTMYHFIKKGIRGGLVQCSGRYDCANNKYMKDYNSDIPSKYLTYLDANNLYGWAMSEYLPISGFKWLNKEKIERLEEDILNIPITSDKGYILCVDLEYPSTLHKEHNDLPFAPENIIPPHSKTKTPKLIASLQDKKQYIIHYRNLQQCLRNGLKLTAIHEVLEFDQSPWLKAYIDLNTQLRSRAKNTFEKDFYKLMNNAIFGKTMENVDKRVDVKIVTQWERDGKKLCASSLIAKPNFNSSIILGENLVIIQMNRVKTVYDKPIYAGFAILDLSKTLMYDFHYGFMKPLYKSNISLLYTDTDSFIYSIETDDFYNDLRKNINAFDTSDYHPNNKYNIPLVNKKIVGKFKDECNGDLILQFVGTRAKSYCIVTEKDVIKKIKGINRNVASKNISIKNFVDIVHDNNSLPLMNVMTCIRSKKHNVYTQLINKVSLSGCDDKRFIVPNSTSTLAWGNINIDEFYFT